MHIPDVLKALYTFCQRHDRIPSYKDREIGSAFREARRKVGSTRKALYIAGAIPNERKKDYPQMRYMLMNGKYELDKRSKTLLKKLGVYNSHKKETVA